MTTAEAVYRAAGFIHQNQAMRLMAMWDAARGRQKDLSDIFTGSAVSILSEEGREMEEPLGSRYGYYFRIWTAPRQNGLPDIFCQFTGIEDRSSSQPGAEESSKIRDFEFRDRCGAPALRRVSAIGLEPDPSDPKGKEYLGVLTVKLRLPLEQSARDIILPETIDLYIPTAMPPRPKEEEQ